MRTSKFFSWMLVLSIVLSSIAETQTAAPPIKAGHKTAKPAVKTVAAWNDESRKIAELLNDPDISSDADVKHALYMKWANAECQAKRLKVQQALGGSADSNTLDMIYNGCMERKTRDEVKVSIPAVSAATPSTSTTVTPPPLGPSGGNTPPPLGPSSGPRSGSMPNVPLPEGCNSLPNLKLSFDTTKAPHYTDPSNDQWTPPPHWVRLNANSSGAEITTKSTVWVGYINQLRYGVTLGGVTTIISAPTVPTTIFPTTPTTPQTSKSAGTPAPSPAPLVQSELDQFNEFNECYDKIQAAVVALQSALAGEEILLNNTRERIQQRLDGLQPIVNTIDEARAAASPSIFPDHVIPPFPLPYIVQLRGILTEFIGKYALFSAWASANGRGPQFQAVSNGSQAVAKILDGYLGASATTVVSDSSTNTPPSGPGGATGSTTAGSRAPNPAPSTTLPAQPPDPRSRTSSSRSRASSGRGSRGGAGTSTTAAAGGAGGAGTTATATTGNDSEVSAGGTGAGAVPGSGTSLSGAPRDTGAGGASSSTATPPSIPAGSDEVKKYEANRSYIIQWIDRFQKVATAPAGSFIATFKPPCGSWFGQGTSTQMQITVSDSLNPTQTSPPRNLDKVVCQPSITVTNGLGLSFIPDRTPAFVAGVKTDASGKPVLDSSGNAVIIQTLGYSSSSTVRPAYAMQVNAALWSPKHSQFEIHWGVGAMLTAATGGATTDIVLGPSFSFRRRTFFVTPVYDLGLRTVFQDGFTKGTPQGNLTSPPTQQSWKSGFGLTITFPFTPTSSTTNSSSSSGNGSTPSTGASTPEKSDSGKGKGGGKTGSGDK